jgi:hypothetical protein
MKPVGKLVININVSVECMRKFSDSIDQLSKAFSALRVDLLREKRDLYRQEWWKRGEGEPEYLADLPESEWWRDGDAPPDYECAA